MIAGIRFTNDNYIEVDSEGGGGGTVFGGFGVDLRDFPKQMSAGQIFNIPYTLPDGGSVEFTSSASSSKIKISATGKMECIGSSTGFCGIHIIFKKDDTTIIDIHEKVEVI